MDDLSALTAALRGNARIEGANADFLRQMNQFIAAAPAGYLTVNSGYRSPERQAQLYQQALAKYGSEREARRWVAPPGRSQHNHGNAMDLGFGSDAARQWAHQNAGAFGLSFPLSNEAWHVELAGAREAHAHSVPPAQVAQQAGFVSQPLATNAGASNNAVTAQTQNFNPAIPTRQPGFDFAMLGEALRGRPQVQAARVIRGGIGGYA